jgi:hypothetical protein
MLGPNSRYRLTTVTAVVDPLSGKALRPPFMDLRQRVLKFSVDDRFVVANASITTWSNLGLKLLLDARAYWAVADLSGIVDPFTELSNGTNLRSPSVNRYLFSILADQRFDT